MQVFFKFSPNLCKIIGCTKSWVAKIKDGMKVSQDIHTTRKRAMGTG